MSVSIAGVVAAGSRFKSHLELGEVAAEVKRMAKAQPGSRYCFDRRVLKA